MIRPFFVFLIKGFKMFIIATCKINKINIAINKIDFLYLQMEFTGL